VFFSRSATLRVLYFNGTFYAKCLKKSMGNALRQCLFYSPNVRGEMTVVGGMEGVAGDGAGGGPISSRWGPGCAPENFFKIQA
jgi:hypothetical protein